MSKINPKCQNCGFENINGAQFCFKCGTKLEELQETDNNPNDPHPVNDVTNHYSQTPTQPTENKPFIDASINECEINGITYRKILATCPDCFSRARYLPKTNWKHKDDNCFGHMYVGSDGTILCGKCGKKDVASNWNYVCANHDNSEDYYIFHNPLHSSNIGAQIGLGFVSQMANLFGSTWLKTFLQNSNI